MNENHEDLKQWEVPLPDGMITLDLDIRALQKLDIHVSFSNEKIVIKSKRNLILVEDTSSYKLSLLNEDDIVEVYIMLLGRKDSHVSPVLRSFFNKNMKE